MGTLRAETHGPLKAGCRRILKAWVLGVGVYVGSSESK